MIRILRLWPVWVVLMLGTSTAQVNPPITGTPPFGSFGGGPFDVVNLGNLNYHFAIPVLHKAGRGMPFTYDLSYDSSIWSPVTSSGVTTWQPVLNWGWRGVTEIATGYASMSDNSSLCYQNGIPSGTNNTLTNWVYHDTFGTSHTFTGSARYETGTCGSLQQGFTSTTADGSGLTLTVSFVQPGSSQMVATISSRGGKFYNVPINTTGGVGTVTDANGNQMNANNSGQFFDTLSSTSAVLTVAGTPPTSTTFTYTGPSGAQAVTMAYVTKNVKTNFGCTGVNENTQNNISLVSSVTLADGSLYSFQYETTPGNSGYVTGRLSQVTLSSGGTIAYTYPGPNDGIVCADGSTAELTRTLTPGGEWTYTRSLVSGTHWKTTTTSPPDPANSGSASDVTVIDFQEDSATSTTNNFYETQRLAYQGSTTGTLLATILTCYNGNSINTPSSCPTTAVASPIQQQTVFTYLPNSSGVEAETDTHYGQLGLVHDVYNYDYASGEVGTLLRHVNITYASLGNGIADHPSGVTTYDGGGTVTAETGYNYDETTPTTTSGTPQHVAVSGSRGNLTTLIPQVSSSKYLYRTFTYYDTGMLNTASGLGNSDPPPSSGTTTYSYGSGTSCGNSFVTSVSEPLSLSRSMTWDCNGGVLASVTDENGKVTSYTHNDPRWRLTAIGYPDGGSKSIAYATSDEFPWTITTTTAIDSTQSATNIDYLDGLGRTYAVYNSDPNSSNGYSRIWTTYNALGEVETVTNPYFTSSDPTYGSTSFSYDALARTTKVTNPDGTYRTNSYTDRAVLLSDEVGNQKAYQFDGLGRLQYVCDGIGAGTQANGHSAASCGLDVSASGFLATYGYSAVGDLTSVNFSGQTRSLTYDRLSRMLTSVNPESGTITNVYDTGTAGDLYTTTFPKPNASSGTVTATYTFDAMHRPTLISYDDGSNGYALGYDAASDWNETLHNTKGRMSSESHSGYGASVFSYDSMGRVTDRWEATPLNWGGTNYHMGYTYNLAGEVATITDNPGTVFTNAYNSAGELTSVTSSYHDTSHPSTLFSSASYNPFRELAQATYGDGLVRVNTYDTLGRVTEIQDGPYATPAYRLYLHYYNNGTVSSYQDNVTGRWNYTYDPFNRLATAALTQTGNQNAPSYSYSYDEFGNRWQQHLTAGTGYEVDLSFNSSNRVTTSGYTYDVAGNLTADGTTCSGTCWTYDEVGNLVAGPSSTYAYDGLGTRVERTNGTARYDFVVSGGRAFDEYQGPTYTRTTGGLFTYANSTTYFNRTDNLGTPRASTDYTGTVQRTEGVLMGPFADNFTETMSSLDFTGFASGDWDTENNGDHFGAREYSKTEGRWLTPDPAGLAGVEITNPQSWNRYAYALNNPVRFTDPSGLVTDTCGDGWDDLSCDDMAGGSGFDPGYGDGFDFSNGDYYAGGGPDWTFRKTVWGDPGAAYVSFLNSLPDGICGWTGLCNSEWDPAVAANNGSWLQNAWHYIKSHPITISVSEILAAQITYQHSTKTICGSVGAGASVPPTNLVTAGILNEGNMQNWQSVVSGPSYSFSANLFVGYQGSFSSSGNVGGPSITPGIGVSGSYTIGGCGPAPW